VQESGCGRLPAILFEAMRGYRSGALADWLVCHCGREFRCGRGWRGRRYIFYFQRVGAVFWRV